MPPDLGPCCSMCTVFLVVLSNVCAVVAASSEYALIKRQVHKNAGAGFVITTVIIAILFVFAMLPSLFRCWFEKKRLQRLQRLVNQTTPGVNPTRRAPAAEQVPSRQEGLPVREEGLQEGLPVGQPASNAWKIQFTRMNPLTGMWGDTSTPSSKRSAA